MSTIAYSTIATYAPRVHLFPYGGRADIVSTASPNYAPCSAEWFLQHTQRLPSGTHHIPDDDGATSPLRQGNFAPGRTNPVPAYVHVKGVSGSADLFDIQYWLFYAVRGRSTGYVRAGRAVVFDLLGPHSRRNGQCMYTEGYQGPGEHVGDWKHVTVRVDDHANLQGVFFAQHDGGFWLTPDEVSLHGGTHPIVYSARNTHSCYPTAGRRFQYRSLAAGSFGLGLLELTADGGDVWDTSKHLVIAQDETAQPLAFTPPSWLSYSGYWSPCQRQRLAPATFARPNLPVTLPRPVRQFLVWRAQVLLNMLTIGALTPPRQLAWTHGDSGQPNGLGSTPPVLVDAPVWEV